MSNNGHGFNVIYAAPGEMEILPCNLDLETTHETQYWTFSTTSNHSSPFRMATKWPRDTVNGTYADPLSAFRGRWSIVESFGLEIRDITPSLSGYFRCGMSLPNGRKIPGELNFLNVTSDEPQTGFTRLATDGPLTDNTGGLETYVIIIIIIIVAIIIVALLVIGIILRKTIKRTGTAYCICHERRQNKQNADENATNIYNEAGADDPDICATRENEETHLNATTALLHEHDERRRRAIQLSKVDSNTSENDDASQPLYSFNSSSGGSAAGRAVNTEQHVHELGLNQQSKDIDQISERIRQFSKHLQTRMEIDTDQHMVLNEKMRILTLLSRAFTPQRAESGHPPVVTENHFGDTGCAKTICTRAGIILQRDTLEGAFPSFVATLLSSIEVVDKERAKSVRTEILSGLNVNESKTRAMRRVKSTPGADISQDSDSGSFSSLSSSLPSRLVDMKQPLHQVVCFVFYQLLMFELQRLSKSGIKDIEGQINSYLVTAMDEKYEHNSPGGQINWPSDSLQGKESSYEQTAVKYIVDTLAESNITWARRETIILEILLKVYPEHQKALDQGTVAQESYEAQGRSDDDIQQYITQPQVRQNSTRNDSVETSNCEHFDDNDSSPNSM